VTAFGLTTAASYAYSGLISWPLAGLLFAGASRRIDRQPRGAAVGGAARRANSVFAAVIIAVALYMLAAYLSSFWRRRVGRLEMTKSIDRPDSANRYAARQGSAARRGAAMLGIAVAPESARGKPTALNRADRKTPGAARPRYSGRRKPDGDISIVEYFDTSAVSFLCRKLEPELRQVVAGTPKVPPLCLIIGKDCHTPGPISVVSSQMALARRYREKFVSRP